MLASLREFNLRASELALRAQGGEVITIIDRGQAIADLGPHRRADRFADKDEVLRVFAALPAVDHQRFRSDLDALVDHEFTDRDE